jgi:hypothetical protein
MKLCPNGLETRPPRQVLAFDLLHGELPDDVLLRRQMPTISAPFIGVISGNAKGFQQCLEGQEDVVRTVAQHVG